MGMNDSTKLVVGFTGFFLIMSIILVAQKFEVWFALLGSTVSSIAALIGELPR